MIIGYKPTFIRQFDDLPKPLQDEVMEKITLFAEQPQSPSLRVHKLKGQLKGFWSFSVNYRYRIVFFFEAKGKAALVMVGDHSIYD